MGVCIPLAFCRYLVNSLVHKFPEMGTAISNLYDNLAFPSHTIENKLKCLGWKKVVAFGKSQLIIFIRRVIYVLLDLIRIISKSMLKYTLWNTFKNKPFSKILE